MTKLPSSLVMFAARVSPCWLSTATCTRAKGSPRSTLTTLPLISEACREVWDTSVEEKQIAAKRRLTAARRSRIASSKQRNGGPVAHHPPAERRSQNHCVVQRLGFSGFHYFAAAFTSTPAHFSSKVSVEA